MKGSTTWLAAGMSIVLLGTALAGVKTDHDRNVEFAGYRTYAWVEQTRAPRDSQAGFNATGNDLADRRIRSAVDSEMQAKGLVQVSEGEPDLRVAFQFSVNNQTRITSSGYGYGRRGGWNTDISTYSYREGTLVVDLYDEETDHLVWRGSITKALGNPKNPERRIRKVIGKIFKKYPPETR